MLLLMKELSSALLRPVVDIDVTSSVTLLVVVISIVVDVIKTGDGVVGDGVVGDGVIGDGVTPLLVPCPYK